MVIELKIPWRRIIKDLKSPMLFITIYMIGISILDHNFTLEELHVPISLITVPGTVIALLLGFRTNSAYDRWWEARIIWGAIVNDSRTWVRQLMTFVKFDDQKSDNFHKIETMASRQIAWNYALSAHLRRQNSSKSIEKMIDRDELKLLNDKSNVPNGILYNQAVDLKSLYKDGKIDSYQLVQLDKTLSKLTDSMGKCERIKNTVFPSSYSLLVDLLIYMWIIFLPFGLIGLVDVIGYVIIPATTSLAFSFLVIDRIAVYMQDPFENKPSDTPMLTLSRAIEINIKQELNETDIPRALTPINGVLM